MSSDPGAAASARAMQGRPRGESHPGTALGQDGVEPVHRIRESPKIHLQTILDRVEKFKWFLSRSARPQEQDDGLAVAVKVRPRKSG